MSSLIKTCLLASGLALTACAATPSPTMATSAAVSTVQSSEIVLDLKSGQVLQFALIEEKDGAAAEAVRERYFQTAIPHAARLGDVYLGNLRIRDTIIGQNKPRAIALWAFPDIASQDEFRSAPEWPDYVRMRQEGWDELHVYSAIVPEDMSLSFKPGASYTMALAWTRPNTMDEYARYLDGIEADFDQIGARYLETFSRVDLQSTVEDVPSPTHLTLVEWKDGPDLDGLRETAAYKANAENFQKAVSRFDLYSVHFPIPPKGVSR